MQCLLFFGAGSSHPFGIPTMQEFSDYLPTKLDGTDAKLFSSIRQSLGQFMIRSDLEAMFTVLNEYASAGNSSLLPPGIAYRYREILSDATRKGTGIDQEPHIESLRGRIQSKIVEACEISGLGEKIFETFSNFLTHISRCLNKDMANLLMNHDVNFYTTNYDRIIETFVNLARTKVPSLSNWRVEDGTTQTDPLHWNAYNYHNQATMLVPLHGSIDLHTTESGVVKFQGRPPELYGEKLTGDLLIFPVRGKYVFEDPFAQMFSLFRRDLEQAQFAVFVGFSLNDEAILGTLTSIIERRLQLHKLGQLQPLRVVVMGTHASATIDEKLARYKKFAKAIDGPFEDYQTHSSLENLLKATWG